MKIVGIVCEYNPFHMGHQKQFEAVRRIYGPDSAIVCAMSGNFVQRGAPAVLDKSLRAEAAVRCGANLVVELPVTVCLSSAEGFAAGGVKILSRLCDALCFGAETADRDALLALAEGLLRPDFSQCLREKLEAGCSFPAARQAALEEQGLPGEILSLPNNILAVEYCKAILSQNAKMEILPIHRPGSYHAREADRENPSATAVRERMTAGQPWQAYVPEEARKLLSGAPLHTLEAGERAVLARLRTMTDEDYAALPYGSEGLWRKLMHAARSQAGLEQVLQAVKSKRYTRSRLDRMVMCAFLGIGQEDLNRTPPYARILTFDGQGQQLLNRVKEAGYFRNAGQRIPGPWWELEQRAEDLYGLFSLGEVPPAGGEARRRVRRIPGRLDKEAGI